MFRRSLILLSCILLFSPALFAQGKRPMQFEDMMALQRLAEPVPSPDGKWVAFEAVQVDLAANKKTPHIWVVPLAGGEPRQLTSDPAGEARPRWSPDGKHFLFVSAREGGSQVWVADFDSATGAVTGEPRRVTSIPTEADGPLWSPDGSNILFLSTVFPDCPDLACNRRRLEEQENSPVKAMIFTRLLYRHWNTYQPVRRSHLFVVAAVGGEPRDLTPGDHDVPPFSLGGQDQYVFSPDGKEVAYTSNIDKVEATSTNNQIFLVPAAGGEPKQITDNPGADGTPLYSPDGRYIAYRAQFRAGYESDRWRLMLYDRQSGERRDLTSGFDLWVDSIAWSPDSRRIYFTAEREGSSPIFFVDVDGGPVREAGIGGSNHDLVFAADGVLLFGRDSVERPNEIYKAALAGQPKVEALTRMNNPVFANIETTPLESFWFTGADETRVQGFLVKPPRFQAGKKYPVKFLIHGGPQGAWGDSWSFRWNPEMFASDGYVVVMVNPRGSTGYGQKFIDQINRDWDGLVFDDLMLGLDHVQQTYGFVDKDRVCALGGSFGGYMVDWILGHSDRFKCLVSHDGVYNLESMYGTTEELWFPEWEFGGPPWESPELYRRMSPHVAAASFKTPTLVVHGQLDYRVDVSEGFQLFTALQRQGVPSKMLYFPDEGHWVLKPRNSQLWYQTVNGWVDSYLKPAMGANH